MSDLATFGEHARTMATAMHKPECPVKRRARFSEDGRTVCQGCVTDSERALWTQIADEIEAYLAPDDAEGLFA